MTVFENVAFGMSSSGTSPRPKSRRNVCMNCCTSCCSKDLKSAGYSVCSFQAGSGSEWP